MVQYSNHPAYPGSFKGYSISSVDLNSIFNGLSENHLEEYDVVLTGYCKSEEVMKEIERIVKEITKQKPNMLYICDPVLGDNGKFYVPQELANLYRTKLIPLASAITPNQFEAEVLTGTTGQYV